MSSLPIVGERTPTKRGNKKKVIDTSVPLITESGTKTERLHALYNKWYDCQRCQLCQTRDFSSKQDIVFGEGNPETTDIVIVGEA